MADTGKEAEDSPTRGFSIVDSLPSGAVAPESEEITDKATEVVTEERKPRKDDEQNAVGTQEDDKRLDDIDIIILDDSDDRTRKGASKDCTLIITTEDLLDNAASADDTVVVEAKENKTKEKSKSPESVVVEAPKVTPTKPKLKKDECGYFWVSNITRQVKAADLKKFFSQAGKVLTAKILTNGRSYFGYVSMSSEEAAFKCIKQMNNAVFDGKKITVTKVRPDTREPKIVASSTPKKRKIEKPEPKKAPTPEKKATEPKDKRAEDKLNAAVADLKRKLDKSKSEAEKYRQKIMELERRHEGMRKKCETLERELKDGQYKVRNERRRLNQDRDEFEKTKKVEQIRFEADRAAVNRELDEVKKLREHLKEKIDEFKAQSKKAAKRRSRSPPVVRRELRPEFRADDRKRKRDASRGRTPPPPPKLGDLASKKRNERAFFGQQEKRAPAQSQGCYDFRHKPGYGLPQDEYRGHWPAAFAKEARRPAATPAPVQPYQPEARFTSYQFGSGSGVSTQPSRSYYHDFGKPYGPY